MKEQKHVSGGRNPRSGRILCPQGRQRPFPLPPRRDLMLFSRFICFALRTSSAITARAISDSQTGTVVLRRWPSSKLSLIPEILFSRFRNLDSTRPLKWNKPQESLLRPQNHCRYGGHVDLLLFIVHLPSFHNSPLLYRGLILSLRKDDAGGISPIGR